MRNIKIAKDNYVNHRTGFYIFENIGLKLFQSGLLLLASVPSISFVLLFFSSIFGAYNRSDRYFQDKYNLVLIFCSLIMIFNCFLITVNFLNIPATDISLSWIGLLNWLPLFWCYWGFQKYLITKELRANAIKLLIIGSIPVLISGFCQYFLKMYGPYRFFNNLIIWYQRPPGEEGSISGLFNNPNYAGAWLCIIFPLCLVYFLSQNRNRIFKYFNFSIVFSFVVMIVLTTSRSALLAILFSYITLQKFNKSMIIYVLLSLISIIVFLKFISFIDIDFQNHIFEILPTAILKKFDSLNLSSLYSSPRLEIWGKSLKFINENLFFGYGAGSFPEIYKLSNGKFEDIQHTHNIFLEIAFNHGIFVSIIILFFMFTLLIKALKKFIVENKNQNISFLDKAWIISFTNFLIIHLFDITYFDGRISILSWTLLAGLKSISKDKE
tara:strand:+ start:1427 stop:2743 length:1317 start_codon:yes stop_codon:yes gene_type:complete